MPDKRQGRTGQVTINGRSYFLFEEIGRGAASICYRAICDNKRYVVKEFFPAAIAVRGDDGNVIPSNEENADETFTKKKTEFIRSAKFHQNRLHDIQQNDFLSVIEYDEENGFVVMNDTDGQTLAAWAEKQTMNDEYVRKCIQIVKGIIDETEKYHKAGYVHLDLKAENVYKFNIENEQTLTRIFDFDSIQSIDSLYDSIQSKTAHIHTTNECYGKEIRDINSQKADYIIKEMLVRLDYYAIIKILHFLLYGCYEKTVMDDKTPFEEYYAECTVLNNYLGNLFYGLLKPIDKRNYTAGDIKVYLDKLGFIIDNQRHWTVYSRENLRQNFKSSLMSDIKVGDTLYTMNKGISAVEQVAENYDGHLFLHGYDGGSGKTTAMQWLMFRMTGDLKPICLYVPLNSLGSEFDVEEQICQRYGLKEIPENAVILFDGYNEVENKNTQADFENYIKNVLPERNYRVIISGRNIEGLFADFICCILTGLSETQRKRNRRIAELLGKDIFSNPMLVSLYSGIDINNIPAEAKKHMIGVVNGDKIEATTVGEALWNYFYIQIYEKSNGDERAEEEYKRFLLKILPKIYVPSPGTIRVAATIYVGPYENLNDEEKRIFTRCNKLFKMIRITQDTYGSEVAEFTHQNYYDFFKSLYIVDSVKDIVNDTHYPEALPRITDIAADLIGVRYTFPKITENYITVPKGYGECYFGNGKEIVEDERTVIYISGKNLALELINEIREGFCISEDTVADFIRVLPHKHMDFSRLNIGLLLPHDYDLYDYLGFEYGQTDEFGEWIETFESCSETFTDADEHYEDVCFDGAYLKLQDNSALLFKNCSFKRLKKGSKIPYALYGKARRKTIKIGNCIYSQDKSVLIDYVGSCNEKEDIILFENTQKICDGFKQNCKNPNSRIVNNSKHFILSDKVLYKIYPSGMLGLEFCERDIKKIITDEKTVFITSYSCAYCKDLALLDVSNGAGIASKNALHASNSVETLITTITSFPDDRSNVFSSSVKKIICHRQRVLDLYIASKYKNVQYIYIADTKPNGSVSGRGGGIERNGERRRTWEYIRIYNKQDNQKHIDLTYCLYDGNPDTVNEYIPKNLTIYLPFEPDKDEIFGIKLKKYEL